MSHKRLILAASGAIAVVTTVGLAVAHVGNASAAPKPAPKPALKVVVEQYRQGAVRVAAPSVRDKQSVALNPMAPLSAQALNKQLAEAAAPVTQESSFNQWLRPSGEKGITVPGGGQGDIRATGQSYVEVPVLPYYAVFTQNASEVSWLGSQPDVADSVQQTDNWQVSYIGSQFETVDTPPGSVASADGSDVSWTTTVQDNWYSEHSWDELAFEPVGFGYLYRIRYDVTGTFQFGSSFFSVTGDSESLIS